MKQMYLNRINAQERFENGPKTVRVKSRIGSRLVRKSLDSFLTRFCLISLILIVVGGWNSQAWAQTEKKSTFTLQTVSAEKKAENTRGEVTFTYDQFTNTQGIDEVYLNNYSTKQSTIIGTFQAEKMYLQYTTDGSNWHDVGELSVRNSYASSATKFTIGPNHGAFWAKRFRVVTKGKSTLKYSYYVKDFKVTSSRYLKISSASLPFGDLDYENANVTKTAKVTFAQRNLQNDVQLVLSSSEFSIINPTNTTIAKTVGGETSTEVTVQFNPTSAGSKSATLKIWDGTNTYSLSVALSGNAKKLDQDVTFPTSQLSLGEEILSSDVTTSSGNIPTFSSSNTTNIRVEDNYKITGISAGTANVSVHVDGNDYYNAYDGSKSLTITNLLTTYIDWDQAKELTRLTTAMSTFDLDAVVRSRVSNTATGKTVNYTSSNTSVVSVSGSKLTIKGKGTCTLTATSTTDATYLAPEPVVLNVRVRIIGEECTDYPIASQSGEKSLNTIAEGNAINFSAPAYQVTLEAKKNTSIAINGFYVQETKDGSNWTDVGNPDLGTGYNTYTFNLSRNAKAVRCVTKFGATFVKYYRNVVVTQAAYLESDVSSISVDAAYEEEINRSVVISYSNLPGTLEPSLQNGQHVTIVNAAEFGGDCGDYGTHTIQLKLKSTQVGKVTDKLIITGPNSWKLEIPITINTGKMNNAISHNVGKSYLTTDKVIIAQTANSGLSSFNYALSNNDGVAQLSGTTLTFLKSGTFDLTIDQAESAEYKKATASITNIQVSKVTPTIATNPTVATIHYLDQFANNQLIGGKATVTLHGVKDTQVSGTFTWTTLNGQQVTDPAGQHTYSVTFTPTDKGMYNPVTFTMPVTISTATTPTLTMDNTSVDVSRIVPEQEIDHKKLVNLTSLVSALPDTNPMDEATFTYAFKSVDISDAAFAGSAACESSAHIDNTAKTFYATEVGVYTITVTSPATSYYAERSVDFTITVNKLKPTLYFSAEDTVYRVRPVQQAAICVCENETIVTPGVRYASANESAIVEQQIYGKDEYQLRGMQDDDTDQTAVTVTASYAGNAYFQAADDAQKAYVAIAKYTPRFFVDNSEETAERTLYVGQELTTSFIYCNAYNDPTYPLTYAIGTSGVISYNPATRTITAENVGTTTLTFTQTQDGYRYFATRDFNFRVLKNTTELTLADQVKNASLYVGDVLSGTLYTANTEEVPVTITSDNEQVIVYENGELRAVGEGDATITFAMTPKNEKALKWEPCSLTKKLHVSRRANTLSSNFMSITKSYGGSETFTITASNTDYANYPITLTALTNGDLVAITRTSGNSFLIMAKHTEGTVTLRATQEISTEYVDATLNGLTFTVGKSNYHVPIDLNSTMYNDSYCCIKKEGTTSASDNEITLGDAFGGGFNWNDKSVVFRFEGIPDKLTFDFRCYSIVLGGFGDVTNVRWYIQESADGNFSGNTWTSSRTNQDSYESVTIQLQPSTRYVKLCYGGNYSGQFKNVNISERSELVAAEPATTAGAPYVFEAKPLGSDDSEKSFFMDWYNIDEVNVTSSDPHFSVAPSSFAGYEDYGQQPITVIYHRSMDIGLHTATITISCSVGIS